MLNEAITQSPVVVFTGAGASQPLGFALMDSFMDMLEGEADSTQFQVLQKIYSEYRLPNGSPGRDLEVVVESLTRYHETLRLMDNDPNFEGLRPYLHLELPFIGQPAGKGFPDIVGPLDDMTRDLIFREYGKDVAEGTNVADLYGPLFRTVRRFGRHRVIPVFTTNYDRAIETFADQAGVPIEYGFQPGHTRSIWNPERFHDYRAPDSKYALVLFKLHGSVTWYKDGRTVRSVAAAQRDLSGWENMLIYPGETKTGVLEEPYHTCFTYLRHCLYHARCCLVIGYSFRDLFIQRVFQEAADVNPELRILIMNGTDHRAVASQIKELRPEATTLLYRFEAESASYLPEFRDRLVAFLPKARSVPTPAAGADGEPQ
ncbi:MAG: SIR2 family protein [Dehalococcoidia bacterium]